MAKQSIIDLRNSTWGNAYHKNGLLHSRRNLNENDYLVLKQKDVDTIFKILEVQQMLDPKDMYQIKRYINVGIIEDEQEQLNLNFLNYLNLNDRTIYTF
jgi:hypothetical protein